MAFLKLLILFNVFCLASIQAQDTVVNENAENPQGECGVLSKPFRERFGEALLPEEFPWVCALGIANGERFTVQGMGTLITSRYVLSHGYIQAADSNLRSSHARFLDYDFRSTTRGFPQPMDIAIDSYKHAPFYTAVTNENNLVIFKLAYDVLFRDGLTLGCLPFGYENVELENTKQIVVGMSNHRPYNGSSDRQANSIVRQAEKFAVMEFDDCVNAFNESDSYVSRRNFCIRPTNNKDELKCPSAFDGPLHYFDGTKYIIMGLISDYPTVCNATHQMLLMAKISTYLPWINTLAAICTKYVPFFIWYFFISWFYDRLDPNEIKFF